VTRGPWSPPIASTAIVMGIEVTLRVLRSGERACGRSRASAAGTALFV
jgi:hypothetical protein